MASYFPKMPNFGIFNGMVLREYWIGRYLQQSDNDSRLKNLVKTTARALTRYTTVAIPYIKYATSLGYSTAASNSFISGAMILNLAMQHKEEIHRYHPKAARIRRIKTQAIKILPFIAMAAFDIYLLKHMNIEILDSTALLYTFIWTGAELCGKSKELNSLCLKSFKVIQKAYLSKMQRLTNKLFPPSQEEWEKAIRDYERRYLLDEDSYDEELESDYSEILEEVDSNEDYFVDSDSDNPEDEVVRYDLRKDTRPPYKYDPCGR